MSGNDRSGCRPWCGRGRLAILAAGGGVFRGTWYRDDAAWGNASVAMDDSARWCCERCRDLALPPVDSSLAPDAPAVSHHRHGGHAATNNAPAVGEKAGTTSPPSPAPGQRWCMRIPAVETLTVDFIAKCLDCSDVCFTAVPVHGEKYAGRRFHSGPPSASDVYLGPTSSPAPTPATSTPVTPPPSTVTGVGPPQGYVPCVKGCGNWLHPKSAAAGIECWTCFGEPFSDTLKRLKRVCPDWEPPAVVKPKAQPGIKCTRCLTTSEAGDIHLDACPVMRERGPSAAEGAPGKAIDTFADLVDEWDLLPEAGR